MKTLPKLSEYVKLWNDKFETPSEFWNKVTIYTKFITQPLNLSHFVPAIEKDGKWIVLEEPKDFFDFMPEYQEYQIALDNVVFKGFDISKNIENPFSDYTHSIRLKDVNFNVLWKNQITNDWEIAKGVNTIEDLIPYNLEVNETIIKQFKL